MVVSIVLSFTKARVSTLMRKPLEFVGFLNYKEMFTVDKLFLRSIGNTFVYSFAKVFLIVLAVGYSSANPPKNRPSNSSFSACRMR